jgi:uncharacterized protein YjbI with pentapeptide repeats
VYADERSKPYQATIQHVIKNVKFDDGKRSNSTFIMRIFQRLLTFFVALLLLLPLAPVSAQAASSAAIRAYDDAEGTVQNYSDQNLAREEFGNAKLKGANFSGADLQGAVFNSSDLTNANLHGVNFSNGIAYLTTLAGADLSDAIFTSAMLLKSSFRDANVTGADFSFALLDRTQVLQLCKTASGTNPITGVDTRESLGCS